MPAVGRPGVGRVQFQQGEARSRDHAALFLLRHFLPRRADPLASTSEILPQCLMIVMEKFCQLFGGYILKGHGL